MKYILQILLLLFAINNFGQTMYEAPQNNNLVFNTAELPVEYCSGIPDIGIELFNVQTVDPNFSLNFKLQYDLFSNSSIYYSTQEVGDFWRLSISSKITRRHKWQHLPFYNIDLPKTDEMYYEVTPNNVTRDEPDTFIYDIFGLTGKFYFKRENNQFKIVIIEQNDYAKIEFINTPLIVDQDGYTKYKITSFTITDKNGYKYFFNTYSTYDLAQVDTEGRPYLYPFEYYLSSIQNRFGTTLCEYNYDGSHKIRLSSRIENYYYKSRQVLQEIKINNIGKVELELESEIKNTITLKNTINQQLKHIDLKYNGYQHIASNGVWKKNALQFVDIYSKDLSDKQTYSLEYNYNQLIPNATINRSGFLVREDKCHNFSHAHRNYLYYDYGVLSRIINPMGGFTIYEFEPNDFYDKTFDGSNDLDPINTEKYRNNNSNNFTFVNVPLTHQPLKNRYIGNISLINNSNFNTIFVNYDARLYDSDPLRPNLNKFPKLKVQTLLTQSSTGALLSNLDKKNVICDLGYKIDVINTPLVALEYDAGYHHLYNSFTLKVIKYKPDNELQRLLYGQGLRIKNVKYYDKIDPDEEWNQEGISFPPSKEITYNYRNFLNPNASSGVSFYGSSQGGFVVSSTKSYSDLIFYENVSVEVSGLGKTEFTFSNPLNQKSHSERILPDKIVKKDQNGNIIEENIFSRTFKEFNPSASGINKQPIKTYEKVINRNYVNGNSTPLELITESRFDTISRNLTSKKIINSLLNETFEEQYTYVKHNDSYLPKTVSKFKNGIALNRSENFYAIINCIQNNVVNSYYNLSNTKVAKANLPLEVENEYTKYSCAGKLLEYKTKDGVYVSQIWGYNGAFVVAELHNIRYSEINQQILTNLISASNLTDLNYSENNIRNLVDDLRTAHPNAKIKSYTFNPLVGMTSMTDVNGRDEFYEYDNFNRLYRIKDHNSLILKEYNYNYKN
ncbi:hypothetical protein [Flavobacterium sp. I3-2]|uniref:hypothetical protein n=1 Tax=Flavobacterium sp. I3-2 TaxID=2748319 RepID=UPI0015AF2A91|nr:hypothetical protein [Flavobacterium sp. I3-2]